MGSAFGRLPVHFRPFVLHGRHHFGTGNAEACSSYGIQTKGCHCGPHFFGGLLGRLNIRERDFLHLHRHHGHFFEVVHEPVLHGTVHHDLAAGALHEDISCHRAVDAKAHEGAQYISMADETVPAVPGHREQAFGKVHRAIVIHSLEGDTHPFCFMIAAKGCGFHSLHMGCNGLADLPGKGGHKRADCKGPSPVYRIRQIQKPHGHVLRFITGGRKITKYFFSILHSILFPVFREALIQSCPLSFLYVMPGRRLSLSRCSPGIERQGKQNICPAPMPSYFPAIASDFSRHALTPSMRAARMPSLSMA